MEGGKILRRLCGALHSMNNDAAVMRLLFYGAGRYASALAYAFARQGCDVVLTGREGASLAFAKQSPPQGVKVYDFSASLIEGSDVLFLGVKAQAVRESLERLQPHITKNKPLFCLAKGIELETGKPLYALHAQMGFLSGPSFASDLRAGKPAALSLAHKDKAERLSKELSGQLLRLYPTQDIIGISLLGALKNVIAIACGIAEGLGLGASAQASLFARGAVEIERFAVSMGASSHSIMQPAGIGDLALTCFSVQSRNYRFGQALGEGLCADKAAQAVGLVEGAHTARAMRVYQKSIRMPIMRAVLAILEGEIHPKEAQEQLMLIA